MHLEIVWIFASIGFQHKVDFSDTRTMLDIMIRKSFPLEASRHWVKGGATGSTGRQFITGLKDKQPHSYSHLRAV